MKVLLCYPPISDFEYIHHSKRLFPPINLSYIAAFLCEQNIECRIVDTVAENITDRNFINELEKFDPDVIVAASERYDYYLCFSPSIKPYKKFLTSIREKFSGPIIGIGPHPTLYPELFLQNRLCDYIIKGDNPHLTAITAAQCCDDHKQFIDLVTYSENEKILNRPIQIMKDIDILPTPAYHLLPMNIYSSRMNYFNKGQKGFHTVLTSRGCPFQCSYCFKDMISDRMRYRSIDNVYKEIKTLHNTYNVNTIYFFDEIFTLSTQRTYEILEMLKEFKDHMIFGCQTRTDRMSKELLKKMKDAGFTYISYGIESGSEHMLKNMIGGAKNSLRKSAYIIEQTNKTGITAHINTMCGFPGETFDDLLKTAKFLLRYSKETDQYPGAAIFYPHTLLYEKLELQKMSLEDIGKLAYSFEKTSFSKTEYNKMILFLRYNWAKKRNDSPLKLILFALGYVFPNMFLNSEQIFKQLRSYFR